MNAVGELINLRTEDERHLVHRLRDEAEGWLGSKGLDQFQREASPRAAKAHAHIDDLFSRGKFVGLRLSSQIVAVAALTDPDPDFWTPEERSEPQSYISRLLVAEHGRHYGEQLLEIIARTEREKRSALLRLDCWKTNKALHRYYEQQGFRHVRTVDVPGRMSGALFELALIPPHP